MVIGIFDKQKRDVRSPVRNLFCFLPKFTLIYIRYFYYDFFAILSSFAHFCFFTLLITYFIIQIKYSR